MGDRTFEKTTSKSTSLQSTWKGSPLESQVQNYHPLTPAINRLGNNGSVSNHAAVLQRVPSLAPHSLLQLQQQYGNHYVQRVVELAKQGNGQTEVTPEVEAAIERQRGNGNGLDNQVQRQMEFAFGADFSSVKLHTGTEADSLNQALQARAFTTGKDIFFRRGEYNPGSYQGKELLAHELTHVVQQTGGVHEKLEVSQPGDKYEQEADNIARTVVHFGGVQVHIDSQSTPHSLQKASLNPSDGQASTSYVVTTSEAAYIHNSPKEGDYKVSNILSANSLYFLRYQEVHLLDTQGDWLKVEGKAYQEKQAAPQVFQQPIRQYSQTAGQVTGWIKRSSTNLKVSGDTAMENNLIAQDLDNLLDAHVLPALGGWKRGLRIQGNAYLSAYTNFKKTLDLASQQVKARVDFYAAVLTAVSAGALGWLGDAAAKSETYTKLLKSEATRGSLEDALQAGVGEYIDLKQGGWFTPHINKETHPLRYLNSGLIQFEALQNELVEHVGKAKLRISRSTITLDRAKILVEMYNYWNQCLGRIPPNITQENEQPLAKEIERGFWQKYILEDLTRTMTRATHGIYYNEGLGQAAHIYTHPEDAVESRLDKLGISKMAGIKEWDSLFDITNTAGPRKERNPKGLDWSATGSKWTQKLAAWARSYKLKTFE